MAKRGETRARLIETTYGLLQRDGLNGTGVLDILAESGAPRGSLYFHFPGGKEQLVDEAVRAVSDVVVGWIETAPTIVDFFERYARRMERSDFAVGCPVAAVAVEGAPHSERLQLSSASALDAWVGAFARRLEASGHSAGRARQLAELVVCAFQGALVLGRARRSAAPLRDAIRTLQPLLEP